MWLSDEVIALLTFGDDSTTAKVEQLRKHRRNGRPETEEERRAWEAKREEVRAALRKAGVLRD